MPSIPNILAARYASSDMTEVWTAEHKVVLERQLWLAVLRSQRDLGVAVPDDVIEDYEAVVGPVTGQLEAMGNALAWEEEELKKLQ